MTVLAVATTLLFGASWGNPLGVAVLVVAAILAATGIMALIATLARNAEQAANWQSVVAVVLGLVGGTFFPVSQAPGVLSRLTFVAPQAWFLRGLGDLRGGSISAVWVPALAMLIFAVVTGGLAMTRLKPLGGGVSHEGRSGSPWRTCAGCSGCGPTSSSCSCSRWS